MSQEIPQRVASTDRCAVWPGFGQLGLDIDQISPDEWGRTHFVCYDIDALRKINFSYGHAAGDELLHAIADWVVRVSGEKLYRIDGDMFCVLMRGKSFEQVLHFAQSALNRSKAPWALSGEGGGRTEVFVTAALAVVPLDEQVLAQNLTDLFDRCLDKSKEIKDIAVYSREADEAARSHIRFQMDLKNCILHGMEGFSLNYQPIVDPTTGLWRGLEALCRWTRPDHGPVPPNLFVPEVEKLGLIYDMGDWVLKTAVDHSWELGLFEIEDFFLSVNVSGMQIIQQDFGEKVAALLARTGYPPHKLNLEITESSDMNFTEGTRATIDSLRRLGVSFALDDFGTGYSSFNHLKNLPAQYVKTERDFIMDIEKNNYLQYSMYVISETAHLNGMQMICEGIETVEQLRCVMMNGVDLVQGYYYSKPLSLDVLRRSLDRFHTPGSFERVERKEALFSFSQWLASKESYSISPGFFGLHQKCMDLLLDEDDLDVAVNKIIGAVGAHFSVSRVFVFLQDGENVFSNRYEWRADGVESQMHLFQKMDATRDGFDKVLNSQHFVFTTGEHQLPEQVLQRLEAGGQSSSIQSTVLMPLRRRGNVIGFIGLDDDSHREWLPEELLILQNLCLLVLIKLNMWS